MSVKLSYFKGETENIRYINPAGTYSLVLTRENHRYKEEFSGEMIISGDDFQWVMDAGKCTEIFVECIFKRVWNGVFTHTDCKIINLSKKYLEVTPRVDDDYSKFEPWMGLEFNIVPPFNGIDSKVPVYSVNQYGIETRTVRINEPYNGVNSENWEGYSVNDWIRSDGVPPVVGIPPIDPYTSRCGRNSLIYVLNGFRDYAGFNVSDEVSRLWWLDHLGYELILSMPGFGPTIEGQRYSLFTDRYWRESQFTLSEVINYYGSNGEWDYCDLIYKREVWRGPTEPPSGLYWDADEVNAATQNIFVFSGRWMYNPSEKYWFRRYLGLHERSDWKTGDEGGYDGRTGDGFDFTPLVQIQVGFGKFIRKQVLYRNKYEALDYGNNWYVNFYGAALYARHFHKPLGIVQKFIEFIRSEGSPTGISKDDIVSRFFNNNTNPYTNEPNIWKNVLIGQNSDVKRPLATEQATKEVMTFTGYMDMLCSLTNTAWAIIDREFVIEHISYFEKGLTYGFLPESDNILNPYSIINVAKNKGFMQLTDAYSFDKLNMPKFEIFKTDGGSDPKNNNTKIEYTSGCVNNLPKQNIREISLDTTLDYEYTRSEGSDAGLTILSTFMAWIGDPFPVPVGFINAFFPSQDAFGRFVFNNNFTLEDVVRIYHNWGRNDDSALLNGVEWPVTTFKNIMQNVEFRYKLDEPLMENPYSIVATGIGYGIIKSLAYETKGHYLQYELGFSSIQNAQPPESVMDWHLHTQQIASDTWVVEHPMNSIFIFRPVAFDNSGNEIEYDSLFIPAFNQIIVTFSQPVAGTMHFIAVNLPDERIFYQDLVGETEAILTDPLADRRQDIALGLIIDSSGYEIIPESVEMVKVPDAEVTASVTFSAPVTARVSMANIAISSYMDNVYRQNFTGDTVDVARTNNFIYTKPLVLQANKEIIYNSQQLITALRRIGFSESVVATIIVMEKINT